MVAAGLTPCEPEAAFAPDQPPEALHVLAPLDVHVSVDVPPATMLPGEAESDTVGPAAAVTVTVALCEALAEAPLQLSI